MAGVTFTIDLEDHTEAYDTAGRWVANSHAILDFCGKRTIKATFFTVGRAAAAPALLKRIAAEGHELALHSYDHIVLTREDAGSYAGKLADAKKKFEDIAGAAITGFRAPQFSLTPASHWVVDVLGQLGFTYSSSIIAGQGMFHGYPGKPVTPFQWDNGVWELPVPLVNIGPLALPFLGGVYLRYAPLAIVKHWQKQMPPEAVLWTYTHPYDIDAAEGFTRLTDGTPLWANLLLMNNRNGFLGKLEKLLENAAPPLATRILQRELTRR